MRRTVLLVASVALTVLFASGLALLSFDRPEASAQVPEKPNIVFVIVDDMRTDDLRYMPKLRARVADKGMRFGRAFVSFPLCCPSRATIMRGQYPHNTEIWDNNGPDGGWLAYQDRGHEDDNVATRLHDAGYRTGLFGKYLNGYEGLQEPSKWDEWFAFSPPTGSFFDYHVNDNGTMKHFGKRPRHYSTDVLSRQTREFIDESVAAGEPFFAYVAPTAPHSALPSRLAIPAPRHEGTFEGEKAPRLRSFDERYISDKPPWIQALPRLTPAQRSEIDLRHERRVESLQAVDDLVEALVNNLRGHEALRNTYVVFTSDNGWLHGEHRVPEEKHQPYEESVRVPLLVRGPGVAAGSTTGKLVLNTDYLPTFTDLAGVPTPEYVDGRSLRPLLEGSVTTWRTAILLEQRRAVAPTIERPHATFSAVRTGAGKKYVEYEEGGFKELYDLGSDPYERVNTYDAASPPADLEARLRALEDCASTATMSCRAAEDGP